MTNRKVDIKYKQSGSRRDTIDSLGLTPAQEIINKKKRKKSHMNA